MQRYVCLIRFDLFSERYNLYICYVIWTKQCNIKHGLKAWCVMNTNANAKANERKKGWTSRPLSNCATNKEQRRGWGDYFVISFVQTKRNANLSSQPRLCFLALAQYEMACWVTWASGANERLRVKSASNNHATRFSGFWIQIRHDLYSPGREQNGDKFLIWFFLLIPFTPVDFMDGCCNTIYIPWTWNNTKISRY